MEYKCCLPLSLDEIKKLRTGDYLYLTGEIYCARDAAHKRMHETLKMGEKLPIDIDGATIYYMGPSPAKPGEIIGSAGPTTSSRMDKYTPELLALGLKCMIGKGRRNDGVKEAIIKYGGVYLAATGGAGALLSKKIKSSEVIAYNDLGAEAIRVLYIEDFPVIVAMDSEGNDIYDRN